MLAQIGCSRMWLLSCSRELWMGSHVNTIRNLHQKGGVHGSISGTLGRPGKHMKPSERPQPLWRGWTEDPICFTTCRIPALPSNFLYHLESLPALFLSLFLSNCLLELHLNSTAILPSESDYSRIIDPDFKEGGGWISSQLLSPLHRFKRVNFNPRIRHYSSWGNR